MAGVAASIWVIKRMCIAAVRLECNSASTPLLMFLPWVLLLGYPFGLPMLSVSNALLLSMEVELNLGCPVRL